MSKEKQIEEIFDIITTDRDQPCDVCEFNNTERCFTHYVASRLYNAGYRKQSEWISVDERLPELLVDVLVCYSDGNVNIDFRRFTTGGFVRSDVTHWMPLPEAPKMKGGAE